MRIACIGCGYFAAFHLEAWQRLPGVELVALCDLDQHKALSMAERFSVPAVYQDFERMLQEQSIDLIDLIVPPDQQIVVVLAAMKRGVSLICQKPFGRNLSQARTMVQMAEEHQCRLLVHENFRFQPWYREMKRQIEEGRPGSPVHQLYFRTRMGDGWAEDAYLDRQPYFRTMPRLLVLETGIHFIDTFRYLLGEITEVYARLRRRNPHISGEDEALILFRFENGAEAVWDASRYHERQGSHNPRYTFGEAWLEGPRGQLHLQPNGELLWQALGRHPEVIPYPHADQQFAGDCVYYLQEHLLQCLRERRSAETEASLYLQNLRIQEAVYRSAEQNLPQRLA